MRSVLIVDDNRAFTGRLARLATECGFEPVVEHNTDAARKRLRSGLAPTVLILEEGLSRDGGVGLLRDARACGLLMEALLLTRRWWDEGLANQAFELGAHFATKPIDHDAIRRWLAALVPRRPNATGAGPGPQVPGFDARLGALLETWRRRYALTRTEAEVLARAARGETRAEIIAALGCAPATIKKHCHNLLEKTGGTSLEAVVGRLLRMLANASFEAPAAGHEHKLAC